MDRHSIAKPIVSRINILFSVGLQTGIYPAECLYVVVFQGSGFAYCGCWGVKYSVFGPGSVLKPDPELIYSSALSVTVPCLCNTFKMLVLRAVFV